MFLRSNTFRLVLVIGILIISVYSLIPTIQQWLESRHISSLPQAEKDIYVKEREESLQRIKEKSLKLGLDLQGGMHLTYEVDMPTLTKELAQDNADETLNRAIRNAFTQASQEGSDFIDNLLLELQLEQPNIRLSRYFRSEVDNIYRSSSNDDIISYLKAQRASAIDRITEVLRTRIDRYGVTEPTLLKQGTQRIIIELPGVSDRARVRKLLEGAARLEFRLLPEIDNISSTRERVFAYYDPIEDTTNTNLEETTNPLWDLLQVDASNSFLFGYAKQNDTSDINRLLMNPEVQRLLPRNAQLMWSVRTFTFTEGQGENEYYQLLLVNRAPELTGDVITSASLNFDPLTNEPLVDMRMNSRGTRRWSLVTGANIGNPIAIILDGHVYSSPIVNDKITNGRSSINGLSDVDEATDLVNILLSGAIPVPLTAIEEKVVGPTLGETSVQAGLRSIIAGFILVAIFMIIYYRRGGTIADIALMLNVIFIIGILAAFNATLTLPGMAGIVLTIGMAVDANVLIFDRIREEFKGGRTLLSAVDKGFSSAMTAIIDANVTTFLVGLILYNFGIGPIKGFAVTLMTGIITSLISAILITRFIIDYYVSHKQIDINIG